MLLYEKNAFHSSLSMGFFWWINEDYVHKTFTALFANADWTREINRDSQASHPGAAVTDEHYTR